MISFNCLTSVQTIDVARVTAQNISEFQQKLLTWYEANGRHFFPWRLSNLSSYELVIAEILLQRTKAETIAKFYKGFLLEFPSWESIAIVQRAKIESVLKPIGLYRQRASRLQHLAIEMVKRKGQLPASREELETIPFMGQYIANAIELLIFDKSSYLLDVNMARVLERYFGERKMADIRYDPYLQKLATRVTNIRMSKELNWAILDFGATICKARAPLCDKCPLSVKCKYYKSILNMNSKSS